MNVAFAAYFAASPSHADNSFVHGPHHDAPTVTNIQPLIELVLTDLLFALTPLIAGMRVPAITGHCDDGPASVGAASTTMAQAATRARPFLMRQRSHEPREGCRKSTCARRALVLGVLSPQH